jgi:hypothetical protein
MEPEGGMKVDDTLRGIIHFGIAESKNRGLEEAARLVEIELRSGTDPRNLPALIRARKAAAEGLLAEGKVACGKLGGLLPAPAR